MTSRTRHPSAAEADRLELQANDFTPSVPAPPALCAITANISALENPAAFFAAHALSEPPPGKNQPAAGIQPDSDIPALALFNLFP